MATREFRNNLSGEVRSINTFRCQLWAFLFGFFYYIYRGAWLAGLIYFLIAIAIFSLTGPGVIIVWLLGAIIVPDIIAKLFLEKGYVEIGANGLPLNGPYAIDKALAAQMNSVLPRNNSTAETDDKWRVLVEYDRDISAAIKKLEPLGNDALAEFKTAYMAINDRSQIDNIAAKIATRFSTN